MLILFEKSLFKKYEIYCSDDTRFFSIKRMRSNNKYQIIYVLILILD